MLQQMAAESTGTAAPIHLQGEPMAEHNIRTSVHGGAHGVAWQNHCTCLWSGTLWRADAAGQAPSDEMAAEAVAHTDQFKAPLWCQSKLLTADVVGVKAKHAAGCEAASMNLEAELLALVKGEQ